VLVRPIGLEDWRLLGQQLVAVLFQVGQLAHIERLTFKKAGIGADEQVR